MINFNQLKDIESYPVLVTIIIFLLGILGFFIRRRFFRKKHGAIGGDVVFGNKVTNFLSTFTSKNVGGKSEAYKFNKSNVLILFIDDEEFPIVENLRRAGWHTRRIKDITNIDSSDIIAAQIIFIDYKGVGRVLSKQEQGIGLIKEIKRKYGSQKRVILYSAYKIPIDVDLEKIVDRKLPKNSNMYEFQAMIDEEIYTLNDILSNSQ